MLLRIAEKTSPIVESRRKFSKHGYLFHRISIKWAIFRETGIIGSGKNPKSEFFLLGFKYTLKVCFESKKFLSDFCHELRYPSSMPTLLVSKSSLATIFQFLDMRCNLSGGFPFSEIKQSFFAYKNSFLNFSKFVFCWTSYFWLKKRKQKWKPTINDCDISLKWKKNIINGSIS